MAGDGTEGVDDGGGHLVVPADEMHLFLAPALSRICPTAPFMLGINAIGCRSSPPKVTL